MTTLQWKRNGKKIRYTAKTQDGVYRIDRERNERWTLRTPFGHLTAETLSEAKREATLMRRRALRK